MRNVTIGAHARNRGSEETSPAHIVRVLSQASRDGDLSAARDRRSAHAAKHAKRARSHTVRNLPINDQPAWPRARMVYAVAATSPASVFTSVSGCPCACPHGRRPTGGLDQVRRKPTVITCDRSPKVRRYAPLDLQKYLKPRTTL